MKDDTRDDRVYLLHIRDAIRHIFAYTVDGKGHFLADHKTQDAVIRNFEIIGEAVKNVSGTLKTAHADIPWKRIAGMRDKMIHEYFGVQVRLVWEVVERDLPDFKHRIEAMLKEMGEPS